MSYDLNVKRADAKSTTIDFRYISLLTSCVQDGYSVVALNSEHNDMNVGIKPSVPSPISDAQLESSVERAGTPLNGSECAAKTLTQLRRITLEINDGRYLPQLKTNKALATYDIIAIKTRNEKVFHSLCIDHDDYDVLTFEMQERLPFLPKRGWINEAIRKGISFEIAYSDAIDDPKMKRTVLANCINVVKMTKGKNILLSSSTASDFSHRSPFDLIMYGSLIGLEKDQAHDAIYKNPENCVKRSRYRKTYEGTICHATKSDLDEFKAKQESHAAKIHKKIAKKKEKLAHSSKQKKSKDMHDDQAEDGPAIDEEITKEEEGAEKEHVYQVIDKVSFTASDNVFLNPNRAIKDTEATTTSVMDVETTTTTATSEAAGVSLLNFSISLS